MSTPLRSLALTALVTTAVALVLPAATASAAPAKTSATKTSTTKTSTVGYDVSYPQCGSSLPSGAAFGVVGVNGGLATKPNGCLATQLGWAWGSSGSTAQPKAQLYVNTADPGQVRDQITDWPTSGSTPYGDCTVGPDNYGLDDQACAWEYGTQRAQNDVSAIFTPAATAAGVDATPGDYVWWLDVETGNTWESGTASSQPDNRAVLEGMTTYFEGLGGKVGIYSTGSQWSTIAGTVTSGSLVGVDSWLAGATTLTAATRNCSAQPLASGGHVLLTQYVTGVDHDHSCV